MTQPFPVKDATTQTRAHDLDVFFRPKSVAVIGATERQGHVGRAVLWNLLSSPFGGTVYPVNPKHAAVLGVRSYRAIAQVPEHVELAVVVTPAETVPGVIEECCEAGVGGAVIISAGFREVGESGVELERRVLRTARRAGIRVIGPNCLGVMCPTSGLNATFAKGIARRGNVALISQSGAICTALLDWSVRQQVGFSALMSTGSMLDVGWGALIDYLGDDPNTQSIVVYMESVGDARSFLSAAREVALRKPILVIKAGRTELAAKAAASHTGSMAGSDAVLDAACQRVGVLRMDELSDVFEMTQVLGWQPRPAGPRLTIVTNAGGPGVLATDALIQSGGELTPLSAGLVEKLNEFLPANWSHTNPIDLIGDASPQRYEKALEIVAADPNCDGLLVIMAPQAMSEPMATAQKISRFAHLKNRPILTSWMGGESSLQGEAVLNAAHIPMFPFPDAAARAFHHMWRYSYNLRALYETPSTTDENAQSFKKTTELIESVRASGRSLLTEFESKQALAAYGIPTVETSVTRSEEEACEAARRVGFPVVVKLNSWSITHKTDVGGVKLSLANVDAVRRAFREIRDSVTALKGAEHFQGVTVQPMVSRHGYELLVGSSVDKQFGPVLMFGVGGELVEVFKDSALGLPPLNTTLARRLMEQTRIYTALQGVRGRAPVDLAALEQLLVRFSHMVSEQSWIQEIDVNPLIASPEGMLALDARIVLYPPGTEQSAIVKPAIRPYPTKYVDETVLADGTMLTIRPIRPEDEPLIMQFHTTLSEQSVYRRYFLLLDLESRTRHERLARICFIDYDREMALVAEHHKVGETPAIVGVGRLVKDTVEPTGELAAVVSDTFQSRGIGNSLTQRLIAFARDEKLRALTASVLFENRPMYRLLEKHGFVFRDDLGEGVLKGKLVLGE